MEVFYDFYRSSRNDTVVKIKKVKMGWEYRLNGGTQMHKIDIFVNWNCVDTRWQQYSTHLHKNSTQNNKTNLGRVRTVPSL